MKHVSRERVGIKRRIDKLFSAQFGTGYSCQPLRLRIMVPLITLLVLLAPAANAVTVTSPTYYWENSVEGGSKPYATQDAAIAGGVAYWCALNKNFLKSCSYAGIAANGYILIATNIQTYGVFTVDQNDQICPSGAVLRDAWIDSNGVRIAPACVDFSSTPPPPPPPPKKVVVLDPGHGLNCAAVGQAVGAIGVTDFPASNPPAGKLREDDLTVSIATQTQQLLSSKYTVILTKSDVKSCPTLRERGQIANNANAKVFISIHINAPNVILGVDNPFGNGTSGVYNPEKPGTDALAGQLSAAVSGNLGTNNRGAKADSRGLAVLKPTVTSMPAVLLEAARLSGSDETILHTAGSTAKVASGIQTTVQGFLSN